MKIGVTGGIGSGKSVLCKMLETMGYPVFNSDLEAKRLMRDDLELRNELISAFGNSVYVGGVLNKPFLSELIFNDSSARKKINDIVHPRVRRAFDDFELKNSDTLVFNEAAILFETGAHKKFDKTILVSASKNVKIARVINRDAVSQKEVEARMNTQWSDADKIKLADFVIINDETESVLMQLEHVLEQLNCNPEESGSL